MSVDVKSERGWPAGWLIAVAAGVIAAILARWLGGTGVLGALIAGVIVFLVFGVLLGMFWGAPGMGAGDHGQAGHDHTGHDHAGHDHGPGGHDPAPAPMMAAPVAKVAASVATPMAVTPMAVTPMAVTPMAVTPMAVTPMAVTPMTAAQMTAAPMAAPAPMMAPVTKAADQAPMMAAKAVEPAPTMAEGVAMKPAGLPGPRGGKGDDLQVIEGIGPVLEKLCHEMGIYHFDQIAAWGSGEIAWMDGNLKGFRGRVTRDKWVAQTRLIGSAGMDEFLRRAKTNDY